MMAAITAQDQTDWLINQQDALGCRFEQILTEQSRVVFLPTEHEEQSMAVQAVDYTGLLTVTDAERFAEALKSGVGCLRGFGFGLMTTDLPGNMYIVK